jgi:hypothetical protein
MHLNSDPQPIRNHVTQADRTVCPLQASLRGISGQKVIVVTEHEALGGEAMDLDIRQVLGEERTGAKANEE